MALSGMGSLILLDETKPYFVNALKRFTVVFCVGHFLRGLTYLATDMPASAKHCHDESQLSKPPDLWACFTQLRVMSMNGNCGDMNYSG
jgi:hypothetical protein